MSERLAGGCICGAVRFTAVPQGKSMHVCHCAMCRRWSGGLYMAVDCGQMSSVQIDGEDAIAIYRSSGHGERVFCSKCGSNLFWRLADGSHVSVSAQAFDDPEVFELGLEMFTDEQPSHYELKSDCRRMTGPETIAFFTQEQEADHG